MIKLLKKSSTFILCICILVMVALSVISVSDDIQKDIFPVKYSEFVEKYCDEYSLDETLVYSIIWVESRYDSDAVSPYGARGLMQIMESTLDHINQLLNEGYSFDDMFDPESNIRCGTRYLRYLIDRFGNLETSVIAYNAGPGRVSLWLENSNYSENGVLVKIPLSETAKYINKVKSCMEKYEFLYE